jgi:hypothetical protein
MGQNDRFIFVSRLGYRLTFFVAGIVKGVTGMGLPTVAMGVLGAIMPPVTAASLLVIPSFVTNFWQLCTGPNFTALMSRLWLMMLGILLGTVAGSRLLTSANTEWTTIGLGAALALYAAFGAAIVGPGAYGALAIACRRPDNGGDLGSNGGCSQFLPFPFFRRLAWARTI